MFCIFFPILLDLQSNGNVQIEKSKYKSENLSEFNSELIKLRKIDSINIIYVSGQDSFATSLFIFDLEGKIIKKIEYLPNSKTVQNLYTYRWENMFLKTQIQTSFFKDQVQNLQRYEYEYSFPKITLKEINEKNKVVSEKVREYSKVDSTLILETNYSIVKGRRKILNTVKYTYPDDRSIIALYHDENKKLGLTSINEKSQFLNAISIYDILPNGDIENMRMLFYDKEGNLIKRMNNRNSTTSVITQIYKDGLLHEVSSSTGKYIYRYAFRRN